MNPDELFQKLLRLSRYSIKQEDLKKIFDFADNYLWDGWKSCSGYWDIDQMRDISEYLYEYLEKIAPNDQGRLVFNETKDRILQLYTIHLFVNSSDKALALENLKNSRNNSDFLLRESNETFAIREGFPDIDKNFPIIDGSNFKDSFLESWGIKYA